MATFTQMVTAVEKKHELTTKKALAEHLGVNASTLGNALKKDSPDAPYEGALLHPVKEAYKALRPTRSATTRAAPKERLGRLRKSGDTSWAAELGGKPIEITRDENRHWTADGKEGHIADDETFKGIITKLRHIASSAA